MSRLVSILCVLLLIMFVVPVLYGFTPAPISERIDKVSQTFQTYARSFPEFPTMDTEYINGATGLARVIRTSIDFFRTLGQAFAWFFKVLWWFLSDVVLGIKAFNILVFNVGV